MGRKSNTRKLIVWMNNIRVAEWIITASGEHKLLYDADWLKSDFSRPLSLSLPLLNQDAAHKGAVVESYFDNLLPDSVDIRKRIQSRFGIVKSTPFELLKEIGRDCIGAVQLLDDGEKPGKKNGINGKELTDLQISHSLSRIVSGNRLINDEIDDFRISIAGAQEKSAFLFHDGKWKQPLGATPTTHIFKLPLGSINNIDLKTSVENEWLCTKIIKCFDIPAADSEILNFADKKVLSVTRFDRRFADNDSWIIRIPQEDMCQALGTSPGLKYQNDGGPGISDIMKLLLFSKNMYSDRITFFKSQILFWLLAAPDGHAKNFSIFLGRGGDYVLAPLYDIMSAYPVMGQGTGQLAPQKLKMAMSVSGKNNHYKWMDFSKQYWLDTGRKSGLSEQLVNNCIDEIKDLLPSVLSAVTDIIPSGFPDVVCDTIISGIKKTSEKL